MKSKMQMDQKLRDLRKLLVRAEGRYLAAIGLRGEGSWKQRCNKLKTQIEMLEWILKDDPEPEAAPGSGYTPEEQRDLDEYGALCNPKRFGE